MWAIIGSSGFESFDEFEVIEDLPRETPFGLCSDGLQRVKVNGHEALFLCRTGREQHLLLSKINYRANIYALKKHGATSILALSSVRSLNEDFKPGDMVVPYQYIDRTKTSRNATFCDDNLQGYVSLTHPICEKAAEILKSKKSKFDFKIHFSQIYVCVEGPQFPTMADAKCFQNMGGSVMGMTAYPEYSLAREAGLHYLPCNFIVDYVPWDLKTPNVDCVIEIRHENHAKALSICEWILSDLKEYAEVSRVRNSLSASLNLLPEMLSADQKAWVNVIVRQAPQARKVGTDKPKPQISFYKGNQPIPKKLQDFLGFINKYKSTSGVETLESVRKSATSLNYYAEDPIDVASVKEFSIKVNGRDIHLRLYHPDPSMILPIMVYVHGGGFVSGTLDSFDVPCRELAIACQRVVISVDYRLAPEHPCPDGLDDAYEVLKWTYHNAKDLKATAEKLVVMGDSSGANYAALATLRAVNDSDVTIAAQVLLYPTVDFTHDYESMELFSQGYLLDADKVEWCRDQFLPKGMDFKDPSVSPLFSNDLDKLPATFIMTAGFDPLRDEGIAYAEALTEKGVVVSHYHFDNMIHAFLNFGKLVPEEVHILYDRVAGFLKPL